MEDVLASVLRTAEIPSRGVKVEAAPEPKTLLLRVRRERVRRDLPRVPDAGGCAE